MDDPYGSVFADCAHEVIGLNEQRAPLGIVEAHIDSMTLDDEQRSALWLLAWSLRNEANARRAVRAGASVHSYA